MRAFLHLLSYVRRTILRARTRSILTVLGTAVALGLLAFVRTLEAGVDQLARGTNVPVLVVFQSSRFCPLTSILPTYYGDRIEELDGVESVLPTLLYINACRANLDLVTLHGVEPDLLGNLHDLDVVSGDLERWKTGDGALVGRRLAERRGLSVGDRVRLANVNVEVGGIVSSHGGVFDNVAFVHLDQLQLARKARGKATEFLVRLEPGADADALAAQIDAMFASAEQPTDTKSMQAFVAGAVSEIAEVVSFARILGYLAVAVVVLILGNTVWISAQTRVRELGVLQTVGATRELLASLVVVESLLLAIAGGLVGVGGVMAWLSSSALTLGIEGYAIDFQPSARVAGECMAAAVVVGLLASIGPVVDVLRMPLADSVKAT